MRVNDRVRFSSAANYSYRAEFWQVEGTVVEIGNGLIYVDFAGDRFACYEYELELIMPEKTPQEIGDELRLMAGKLFGDANRSVLLEYAEQLSPSPVNVKLSARGRDILLALVEGGNIRSMTNRAKHGWTKDVGNVTEADRDALLEALRGSA